MILGDIRYLVGVHLAQKGLPPTIMAPVMNILNLMDTHLSQSAVSMTPEILKEADRLNHAMVLWNQAEFSGDDDDDEDVEDQNDEDLEDDSDDEDLDDPYDPWDDPEEDDDDEDE